MTVILGPKPMSHREEVTCQRLRNAVQLWTKMYTEMGWCDDMREKLGSHMLLQAACSYREVEPRFIRVWLQGPVLQDAAAANRRSCVRNVLTDVAQQEDQDGNHAHADRLLQEALRELTHVTNGSPLTASSVCVCVWVSLVTCGYNFAP